MKENGFSKHERVCNRNDFQFLVSHGKSFFAYPFRCVFSQAETDIPLVRIAVSVSKKRFKHAVDRNRVKRLMREAYRLEKGFLYQHFQEQPVKLDMLVIYTESKILDYQHFRRGMRGMMKKAVGYNLQNKSSFFETRVHS